jgi:hypothetical protein
MKQSITVSQFDDAFVNMGRQDQFSYQGRHALYEWIEQLDEDCGTETELDVIALCCEFAEYDSFEDIQADYSDIETMEDLTDRTTVIPFGNDQYIIQQF